MFQYQTPEVDHALEILEKGPRDPAFDDAWEYLAMSHDPQIQHAMRVAMEEIFGPFPAATGYSDTGEPYWDLELMSRYLGIDQREILQTAEEMEEKWGDASGVKDTRELHKLH